MNNHEHLLSAISAFDTAMLVTAAEDGTFSARPLRIAGKPSLEELWFVTAKDTSQASEIKDDFRVAVTMQGTLRQVSLSGMARLSSEPSLLKSLWTESMRPWFPDGVDDPSLVAIKVVPLQAEYWDASGLRGIKVVFESVKAILRGEKVDLTGMGTHATVTL